MKALLHIVIFQSLQTKNDQMCWYDKQQLKSGLTGGTDIDSLFVAHADICVDKMITSLVLTNQSNHPIAVLGTSDGQLIKVKSHVILYWLFVPTPIPLH
jgi:hypothetical protein